MLFLPVVLFMFAGPVIGGGDLALPVIKYLFSVYVLVIFFTAFTRWIDYYLDIWIITDKRIVDIEQKGLFRREVSEFSLDRIQDVTSETPNFIATILKYGNIRVQTAGSRPFTAQDIPDVTGIKDLILEQSNKFKNNHK